MKTNDLINRMNEAYGRMSKGQKCLTAYITDNYDKAVFLTAAKMGEIVGVSESTVVRFASGLGYKGYPEFQKALEELVQEKLTASLKGEFSAARSGRSGILRQVLEMDEDNLKKTKESLDEAAFETAVETISSAKTIYVTGMRNCAPLAEFLAFYLNMIFPQVRLIKTSSNCELFEQMMHITAEDVIIGISFPRYSMRTLKALEFANERNAKVVTLTDSIHSPLNLYSSCNLLAKSHMSSIVDSMAAPMSMLNALIVALTIKHRTAVVKNVEQMEKLWEDYQYDGNDEIDQMADSIKNKYKQVGEDTDV
ncbi:MAG: MurR/RpiR family transcriptional regulator [Eubacterium sp.]|nr:MurR/RpiR family transcriptional regulator [Eubacterium sp.]